MRYFSVLCCLLTAVCCCFGAEKPLVSNGRSRGAIVLPEKPVPVEKFAAKELQTHLQQITGKKFAIVPESRAAGEGNFYIGKTAFAVRNHVTPPDAPNAFRIRSCGGSLVITGRDGEGKESSSYNPAGTLFGVYDYLRRSLGVRWLHPGPDGAVLPRCSAPPMGKECDREWIPLLRDRSCSSTLGNRELYRFYRRNMYHAQVTTGLGGHNVAVFQKYGAKHPEILALGKDGKRGSSFCQSSPQLHRILIQEALAKNPASPCISAHDMDTTNRCCCENCRAWDGEDFRGPTGRYAPYVNYGERYAHFFRTLLDKGRKQNPGIRVSGGAYQSFFYAPRKVKLDPAIYIGFVPDIPFPRRPEYTTFLRNEYRLWKKSGASLYLRPNYFLSGYCLPELWFREYADEFKFLCSLGIIGLRIDGPGNMYSVRGVDYYIMARLAAEPDADVGQLYEEYLSGFGKAASFIREYIDGLLEYQQKHCKEINDVHENTSRRWYAHGRRIPDYAHKIFPAAEQKKFLPLLEKALKAADTQESKKLVAFLQAGLKHAIAATECAEVIASPRHSANEKIIAWKRLRELRRSLPPYAVSSSLLDKVENMCWSILSPPQITGTLQPLPEMAKVCIDPENKGESLNWHKPGFDDSAWKSVSTWRVLENSGICNFKNAFYRMYAVFPEQDDSTCLLRLGAVDKNCKVWIDGELVGTLRYDPVKNPTSWEEPFEIDITRFSRTGKKILICVKIENDGGHSGIWKPSYLRFIRPASGKSYALEPCSGKTSCSRITGCPEQPERNRFQTLRAQLPQQLIVPGRTVRFSGKIRITKKGSGRVEVSLRQSAEKKKLLPFADLIYKSDCSWEDFSKEVVILPGATKASLSIIARSLPKGGIVELKELKAEMLAPDK